MEKRFTSPSTQKPEVSYKRQAEIRVHWQFKLLSKLSIGGTMIDKLFNITWVLMIIALTWMNLDTVFILLGG